MSRALRLSLVVLSLAITSAIILSCSSIETTKETRVDTFIDLQPPPDGHNFSAIKIELPENHGYVGIRYVAGQPPVENVVPLAGAYLLKKQNDELQQQGVIAAIRAFFSKDKEGKPLYKPAAMPDDVWQQLVDTFAKLQQSETQRVYGH